MLKKYFIPHRGNHHRPHILRGRAVTIVLVALFFIEAAFLLQILVIWPQTGIFSSVLPSVLVDLANTSRAQNNVVALTVNPLLVQAAQLKAQDMAQKGYFEHTSPEGITPWFWLQKVGYHYIGAGENLAVNFSDSNDIANAWMNSPGHRANILDGRFSEIGIATAKGMYEGQETIFVVQFFGRPAAVSAADAVSQIKPASLAKPVSAFKPSSVTSAIAKVSPAANVSVSPLPTENFVAGNQTSSGSVSGATDLNIPVQAVAGSTFWRRLVSMPRTVVDAIYMFIAVIFFAALIFKIFVKIKIQYPKLIFNGVLVLFVVISLLYLNHFLFANGQFLPPAFVFN